MEKSSKRLPRFRQVAEAIRGMQLTPRDAEIIRQIARFRFLRSDQILRLVEGARTQILRRLQALYHHGWLDRPRCQIDFYHRGGSRPIAYGLGSKGAAYMRRVHDLSFSRMVWARGGKAIGRLFLEHTLMVAEIVIAIESTCQDQPELVRFISSDDLRPSLKHREPFHWSANVGGRRIGLVPDAVFALEFPYASSPSGRIVCCIEADRGSMPVSRRSQYLSCLARKFRAYAALWKAGNFSKRFNTKRLLVLTVTSSTSRVQTISDCLAGLPHGKGIFATFSLADFIANPWLILEHCSPPSRDNAA